MKLRRSYLHIGLLIIVAMLFLVACERPLPGGYNDSDAVIDVVEPEIPQSIPQVDPAYPGDMDVMVPQGEGEAADVEPVESSEEGASPADSESDQAAVESAVDQDMSAAEEESSSDEAATQAEQPAAEEPATAADAAAEEAAAEGEAVPEEEIVGETVELPTTHTVAAGENLYRIGLLYGVSWVDIAEANGITNPAGLSIGQVLAIPGPDDLAEEEVSESEPVEEAAEEEVSESEAVEETTEEAIEEEVAESEVEAEAEAVPAERPSTYVVQQGDTLFQIGVNVGVDWSEIAAYNEINADQLYPGQVLQIPPLSDTESVEEEDAEAAAGPGEQVTEGATYIVREGDTVYSVAFQNRISWTTLVELNNLESPYTLVEGESLLLPAASDGE